MIVVNLFGGPGCGKSTAAAYMFAKLKMEGIKCELVNEFAKSLSWDNSKEVMTDRAYVFGKQQHMLFRVKDKVDVVITDSPLLLAMFYGEEISSHLSAAIMDIFNSYNNMNFYLVRNHPYECIGRKETEEQAMELDKDIYNFLCEQAIDCEGIIVTEENLDSIVEQIKLKLAKTS